jgi:hypothetical protein
MSSRDYCGCGHPLDHVAKPCRHTILVAAEGKPEEQPCRCTNGTHTDVVITRLLAQINERQKEQTELINDLMTVTLFANGLEIDEKGQIKPRTKLVGL